MLRWSQSENNARIVRRDGVFAAMCDSDALAVFIVQSMNKLDPPLPKRVCEFCGVGVNWIRRACCPLGTAADVGRRS